MNLYLIIDKLCYINPRELSSVGRDIVFYMQETGFEPRTLYYSTIKLCELAFRLLD